jgi:hypothetical protein
MNTKRFFTGLEEIFGRFVGLFFAIVLFAVYFSAKGVFTANWYELSGWLLLFWLVYEVLSYGFFKAFMFFSKDETSEQTIQTPTIETENSEEALAELDNK